MLYGILYIPGILFCSRDMYWTPDLIMSSNSLPGGRPRSNPPAACTCPCLRRQVSLRCFASEHACMYTTAMGLKGPHCYQHVQGAPDRTILSMEGFRCRLERPCIQEFDVNFKELAISPEMQSALESMAAERDADYEEKKAAMTHVPQAPPEEAPADEMAGEEEAPPPGPAPPPPPEPVYKYHIHGFYNVLLLAELAPVRLSLPMHHLS